MPELIALSKKLQTTEVLTIKARKRINNTRRFVPPIRTVNRALHYKQIETIERWNNIVVIAPNTPSEGGWFRNKQLSARFI